MLCSAAAVGVLCSAAAVGVLCSAVLCNIVLCIVVGCNCSVGVSVHVPAGVNESALPYDLPSYVEQWMYVTFLMRHRGTTPVMVTSW